MGAHAVPLELVVPRLSRELSPRATNSIFTRHPGEPGRGRRARRSLTESHPVASVRAARLSGPTHARAPLTLPSTPRPHHQV